MALPRRWKPWIDRALRAFLIIIAVLLVPIVPFLLFGSYLEPTIETWLYQPSLRQQPLLTATAVVLLLVADILLPIPSSFVGTVAGQVLGTSVGTLVTWTGLNLACLAGYCLAARFGRQMVAQFTDETAIVDVTTLTNRWGVWALIGLRPIPVLAEASILLAGLGRMPLRQFWPVVIAANFGIAVAYSALGSYSAEYGWLGLALVISVAVPVALFFGWWLTRWNRSAANTDK